MNKTMHLVILGKFYPKEMISAENTLKQSNLKSELSSNVDILLKSFDIVKSTKDKPQTIQQNLNKVVKQQKKKDDSNLKNSNSKSKTKNKF
jgi:hypothetical protein